MAAQKPVVQQPAFPAKQPVVTSPTGPTRWVFSFRFWKQIDYFGLGQCDKGWFVSLLDKLADLSKEAIDDFRSCSRTRGHWRYHEIDWTHKNIPIQREELVWLDPDYLSNADEYPLYQFQISRALGRVIGFWDENQIFNIVLLDSLHNMQPAKKFDYRVSKTTVLPCLYSSLIEDVKAAKRITCIGEQCPVHAAISRLPRNDHSHTVTILQLSDDVKQNLDTLIELQSTISTEDIVKAGVEALLQKLR